MQKLMKVDRNLHKHEMRAQRTEDIFGYVDGETEIYHKELVIDNLYDNVIKSIKIGEIYRASEQLPKTQKERFVLHYFYGISRRKIAEMHNVSHTAVNRSLIAAIKAIRNLLELEKDDIF